MLNVSCPKEGGDHKSRPITVSVQRKGLSSVDVTTPQHNL